MGVGRGEEKENRKEKREIRKCSDFFFFKKLFIFLRKREVFLFFLFC